MSSIRYVVTRPSEAAPRRTPQNAALILAVVTATAAQLLDLGTFVRMVSMHGAEVEGNPMVAHLLSELGVPFVAVMKLAGLSLVIAVIAVLASGDRRPSHLRLAAGVAAFAIVAGVFGAWTNASVIL